MLETADNTWAYANIPQHEALEEREDKTIPLEVIVKLMDLIQKHNSFKFHDGQLWKQLYGVAMAIHPAPSFANTYLARTIEEVFTQFWRKYGKNGESAFKYSR